MLEISYHAICIGSIFTLSRSRTPKCNPLVTQTIAIAIVIAEVLVFFTFINIMLVVVSWTSRHFSLLHFTCSTPDV